MRKTIAIGRVKGSMWYSGTEFPISNENFKVLENDMFFDINDYKIYQYINEQWVEQLELTEVFSSYISDEKSILGESVKFATSEEYNLESDNEIPSTKVVKMIFDIYKTVVDGLNNTVETLKKNKADKTEIPTKLSQLEQDVELGAVISLGEIDYPGVVNNEKLNSVTNSGVYTFTSTESYSGGYYVNTNVYFMVVERTDTDDRAVEQFIYSCDVTKDSLNTLSNLSIIRRIKSKNTGTWAVKSIVIPSQEYVDKQVAKLIAEEVDSSPETLNTIKELSDALKENDDVVEALNKAIGNKANKDDVPTNIQNGTGESSLVMSIPEGVADYYPNTASGPRSFAIGHGTVASGKNSFSSGSNTVASHYNTHAEGLETEATTYNAHAEGAWTIASGQSAHAEGNGYATGTTIDTIVQKTIASGLASHAEGQGTQASGTGSHSEGYLTIASQKAAHAEGGETKATRGYSHAGGYGSEANGARSFVHGNYVKSEENDQFIVGTYNSNKTNTIFEVGNGTSESTRKNAFEVLKDGSAKVGAMGNYDLSVATKQYVDKAVASSGGSSSKIHRYEFILYDDEEGTEIMFTFVSSKHKDDFSSDFEFATNVFYYGAIGVQTSTSPKKIWIVCDIGSSYIDISSIDGSAYMSFSENNFWATILTEEL